LLAAGAVLLLSSLAGRAQTTISIEQLSPEVFRLRVNGPPGWTHVLERTTDLLNPEWVQIAFDNASASGLTHDDFPPPETTQRFYRARSSSVHATTSSASGDEDQLLTIALDGFDAADPGATMSAIITSLPTAGTLYQYGGGVPILSVPAEVLDAQRRVEFQGAQHHNGDPYSAFSYRARNSATGAESFAKQVQIALAPVPDPPSVGMPTVATEEDTPKIFQLQFSDPDLTREGDAIQLFIRFTTLTGDLHQVGSDGVTPGDVIEDGDLVTNPNGFVMYVPPANAHGIPLTSFVYYARDQYDLTSGEPQIDIDVTPVNDPPVAQSRTHHGFNDRYITSAVLDVADEEGDPITVCFTAIDSNVAIYKATPLTPENRVTAGSCLPRQLLRVVPFMKSEDDYDSLTQCGASIATFTYYATDGQANSSSVTDTISIACRNYYPDPRTSQKRADTTANTDVEIVLRAVDPDGNSEELLFEIRQLPEHGQLLLPDGTPIEWTPYHLPFSNPTVGWRVIYRPAPGYTNTEDTLDRFGYTMTDVEGAEYPLPLGVAVRVAAAERPGSKPRR
jgi:hypothetical protein